LFGFRAKTTNEKLGKEVVPHFSGVSVGTRADVLGSHVVGAGFTTITEHSMKLVVALAAAASICAAIPASAEEVGVGVGVGPAGVGVTVGSDRRDLDRDRDRDRTTVIKEHEPRDTTVIKEREREPDRKVIIDRDRN
jgi:hypothetical protein